MSSIHKISVLAVEIGYAEGLCDEIDEQLSRPGKIDNKTLRKVVRWMDKSLIHFCRRSKGKRISFGGCRFGENIYATQLKKIDAAI